MRLQKITPLHLMMLLHHNAVATPYADGTEHAKSAAVRDYTQDLLRWDLIELRSDSQGGNPWRTTGKGRAHVHYLCHIPFPT